MIFREALITDIKELHEVRMSVHENALSNPSLVTEKDYVEFLTVRGKGWLCEMENSIVGFAIADLKEHNIWALFVRPGYEGKGIGKKLQSIMLDWYFKQTKETAWLGTSPGTRAEKLYRNTGWKEVGKHGQGEIKFEMSWQEWSIGNSP